MSMEGLPTAGDGPSSSKKPLSEAKIWKLIEKRKSLIKRLEELEQREVSLNDEDWTKEQRLINLEKNLKTCLISIEKKLHENGVLLDEDEDLRAFFSNESVPEIAVAETGNELLNQRLTRIFSEKMGNREPTTTLSFEELSKIMKEVRAEQGESSNIPDPEHECAAFLDRLEHVALVTARAHQNFISTQFLHRLDLFVPKTERTSCSAPPELSAEMKKLLSDGATMKGVPDEIFHMEMQAAGKWEQEHPEETALCDEVDDTCDDGNSEIEEVEDEIEDEENDCGPSSSSSSRSHSPVPSQENGEPSNIAEVKVPDVDDRDVPQCALARSKFEQSCVTSSSTAHKKTVEVADDVGASSTHKQAAKRTADHSSGGEIKKCTGGVTLDKKGEGGGHCMASNEHGSTTTPSTTGVVPPSSDHSDVACIAVVERNAVDQGEAISSKRIRLGKQNTQPKDHGSKEVDIIYLDD